MFWLLTLMAGATFAACVLVPTWADRQKLLRQEAMMRRQVAALNEQLARYRRAIAAVRSDPSANEQLAKFELNYHRPGEQQVPVPVAARAARRTFVWQRSDPSEPRTGGLSAWLPRLPWVELFSQPETRSLLLAMSAGTFLAAFVLYGKARPDGAG